jgi:ribosomal protein S18 acetylase RimI-like enzyme
MADDLNSLLRLTKAQIKPAAEVLGRAFQDYPMSAYFMPDEAKRRKKQPAIYRMLVRSGIKYGEVYATSSKLEGAAVWFSSDSRRESFWGHFISGQFLALLMAGREVTKRQRVFGEYAAAVRQRHVPFRHWYLQLLGVDPAYQGKGYAGALLKPMLARADRERVSCFLETQLEKNVALYEHFGFRVVEEWLIPGSNVKSWAMVRGYESSTLSF